jgi:hypothetical protein
MHAQFQAKSVSDHRPSLAGSCRVGVAEAMGCGLKDAQQQFKLETVFCSSGIPLSVVVTVTNAAGGLRGLEEVVRSPSDSPTSWIFNFVPFVAVMSY